jgi:predicted ATPase
MPYIKSITVNEFNGKFNQIIEFNPYLNILSGINGTGKTKVLKLLKQGTNVNIEPHELQFHQLKILVLSPKRNAEKRAQQELLQYIRTTNANLKNRIQEALNKQIRDETYDLYSSFAELFYLRFEKLRSQNFDSKTQQDILNEFVQEVNDNVVSIILPGYEIKAEWNSETDSLNLIVYKQYQNDEVSLENLSTGEQEILSLAFNIYLTKDEINIFLIDEPEIHLNWTVEKNLFDFLKKFSETYRKQIIVSTHSRIIFDPSFHEFIIYLVWEKGQIQVKKEVPKDYKEKIAGESLMILSVSKLKRKTIFVEDNEHEIVIKELLKIYNKNEDLLEIIKISGGSGNVENLYKVISQNDFLEEDWINAYFLRDGDNEQDNNKKLNFIKLKKYSIESYFLNLDILSELLNRDKQKIKNLILDSIKINKTKISCKTKNALFFEKLIEDMKDINPDILNILDCSQFFDDFVEKLGYKKENFMSKYLKKAYEMSKLEEIFDKELIDFVKNL